MPGPDPQRNGTHADARPVVSAALDVWVQRLIDYSRANSLLFFRDLKVGTLDLTAYTTAVTRLLEGDSLTVEALASPRSPVEPTDVGALPAGTSVLQRVRSALIALQRKAVANREEKGLDTLHLSLGMATWPALDGGRPYAAPVLLLPARIEARGRGGDELRLLVMGEPQINPVLLYVLQDTHGVAIDPPSLLNECAGEDESGTWRLDPELLLSRIERVVAVVPGLVLERRAILANFQFAKMAMVEDLKRNLTTIGASAVVAAIAGHAASRQELARAVTDFEPTQLDAQPPSDDYVVLDADSTQHRAIVLVGKGQNGVIQGPPGTGKSQTIANLIAQSVADGRRVLFVAEKRAALEAVIKRLCHEDVGLGHLVLDLHGASVSRKEVMARLAEALDQIRHATPVTGVETVLRDFDTRRRQLNEHAHRVNTPRLPTELSVNQMIGLLLRLPPGARTSLRLRGDTLNTLTVDRVEEVKQSITQAAANPRLLLGVDPSPWNKARIADGKSAQEALDLATRAAYELWPSLERTLRDVAQQLSIQTPPTLYDVATLLALLRDVRNLRERYAAEIFAAEPGALARALDPAIAGQLRNAWALISKSTYRAARKRLLGLRIAPAPSALLRHEALEAADIVRRWQTFCPVTPVPVDAASEKDLASVFDELSAATKALASMTGTSDLESMALGSLGQHLERLARDQRTPYLLPTVQRIHAQIVSAGLTRFLDELRDSNVAVDNWINRFDYVWLHSALDEALVSDPGLAAFNGRTHEQIVEAFVRLDRERIRLNAARVRRLHAERAIVAMNEHFDQTDLVRRETAKRSRHIALRELLARAPDVLTRIAPCWIASPLSVSQLLDGGRRHFDIVVFDEASQILQEEAIPALYRGEQVVVAGDRHQLPPTTFFATAVEEDEFSGAGEETQDARAAVTAAIGGFESLLDTLGAFLPNWLLEWHYRSEDERLISFSNGHIYDGRLVTFPSARAHEALEHILVTHDRSLGGQEESSSPEVDEVVRQVVRHAETRPDESLGVITMGIKHANRVQAALDKALELRPELSDFFSLDREERFFVKNLETVQGDERDAIILSVGYGKSISGDLPHRFGPLTQDAGYRRLNVAITRAKRRMCVISAFSHDEIDLNRSGSRGVQLLKAYLEYAATGGMRLPEAERAGDVPLNAFESDVRDALEARGVRTRPQFGASRYRIDLVAMHPSRPGRPVLAIECDGASYHSSATARDRDRLRQTHLQRLGWRVLRIWSTDWFYGREQEIERVLGAFEEAVRRADVVDTGRGTVRSNLDGSPEQAPPPQTSVPRPRGARPSVPARESIDHYSDRDLRQLGEWVASDGLLRTDEEWIREIYGLLPFERLGPRIRQRLEATVRAIRLAT